MTEKPKAFGHQERSIAWRYLRGGRRKGPSLITLISIFSIALAVFALIATLGVRSGFRYEFVQTILGANAHITLYQQNYVDEYGQVSRKIENYETLASEVNEMDGVERAAAIIRGQVMASANDRNLGAEIFGETLDDIKSLPLIVNPKTGYGDAERFQSGVMIGSGVARELGLSIGDFITLTSPDGVQTAFGTTPRIDDFEVVYIFDVGRYDIDQTRIYMPFLDAQSYFNREGFADEIEIFVDDPQNVDKIAERLNGIDPTKYLPWTWRDSSGGYLRALDMEDTVMFVLMSVLIAISTMTIVAGLVMLVMNKKSDIGILRTIGYSASAVLRIFIICGLTLGVLGTLIGVIAGALFVENFQSIFDFINNLRSGGAWNAEKYGLASLPARLEASDVLLSAGLALGLSFLATLIPARQAAKLDPVEALRDG